MQRSLPPPSFEVVTTASHDAERQHCLSEWFVYVSGGPQSEQTLPSSAGENTDSLTEPMDGMLFMSCSLGETSSSLLREDCICTYAAELCSRQAFFLHLLRRSTALR